MNYKSLLVRFLIAALLNSTNDLEQIAGQQISTDRNKPSEFFTLSVKAMKTVIVKRRKRWKVANNAVIFNVNEISGLITYAHAAS